MQYHGTHTVSLSISPRLKRPRNKWNVKTHHKSLGFHSHFLFLLRLQKSVHSQREREREEKNGEVFEAKQSSDTAAGTVRRSQGGDRSILRRRHTRQAVRALFGCGDKEVPEQSDPQGLGEEDGQEVPRQGLRQARQLPAPHAHALHLGRGLERRGRRGLASVQGQESHCGQRDQEEARGAFQDWEE